LSATFPKHEKLKSRKAIKQLFEEGKTVTKYPVKLLWLPAQQENTQTGFAVPKRTFKSAVTRNKIKRLMREAYRLKRPENINKNGTVYVLLFLYIGKDITPFKTVETAVISVLQKLDVPVP
jgi:ribonuclease P protein component